MFFLFCFFCMTGLCTCMFVSKCPKTRTFVLNVLFTVYYSLFFFSYYFGNFLSKKSSSPLMLNTLTFNTSCKPKLLHWRGTRATKCPTIFLNKHANICVGPPSNLTRVSALFRVFELACFCEIKTMTRGGAGCTSPSWKPFQHHGQRRSPVQQKNIEVEKFAPHPIFPSVV